MDKARRNQINQVIDILAKLDLIKQELMGELDTARSLIESIRDLQQESFDNASEAWQEGERGIDMQETIYKLDEVHSEVDNLHSAIETTDIDNLISLLDDAKGIT